MLDKEQFFNLDLEITHRANKCGLKSALGSQRDENLVGNVCAFVQGWNFTFLAVETGILIPVSAGFRHKGAVSLHMMFRGDGSMPLSSLGTA